MDGGIAHDTGMHIVLDTCILYSALRSPVAGRPPQRSRRAERPHRAPRRDARWKERREQSQEAWVRSGWDVRAFNDSRRRHAQTLPHFIKLCPVVAAALAPAVELPKPDALHTLPVGSQPGGVADHFIIVVVTQQSRPQCCGNRPQAIMTMPLQPFFQVGQRPGKFPARRPSAQWRLSVPRPTPGEVEPEERKAAIVAPAPTVEADNAAVFRRQGQTKPGQPFRQSCKARPRILLSLKADDEIIGLTAGTPSRPGSACARLYRTGNRARNADIYISQHG